MANIRIRLTNKQRNAVRAEIKRLVDNNLIGTGPKYTAPSRVARLVYANRGLRGLPQLFGSGCVEYYVTQMLKDGDLIAKEDEDGECYLVTKENQNRDLTEGPIETKQENNMEEKEMTKIVKNLSVELQEADISVQYYASCLKDYFSGKDSEV